MTMQHPEEESHEPEKDSRDPADLSGNLPSREEHSPTDPISDKDDPTKRLAEIQAIADALDLDSTDQLLEYTEKSRAAMCSISDQMMSCRNHDDIKAIEQLFGELGEVQGELDVQKLDVKSEPRQPDLQKPKIDAISEELAVLEIARVQDKENLKMLKKEVHEGLRRFEVAIGAGEIILKNARKEFDQQCTKMNPNDSTEVLEINSFQKKINQLDQRLLRLQNNRRQTKLDLQLIDLAISNQESLRATLHDLRENSIPQLRRAMAIAQVTTDLRAAAKVVPDLQSKIDDITRSNLDLLEMCTVEIHEVNFTTVKDSEKIVEAMDSLTELLELNSELEAKREQLVREAHSRLRDADKE